MPDFSNRRDRYTGRLAPSPTGAQHVGNARTYLIAWLAARHAGGKLILRIEDIDSPRVKADADRQAIADLRWLGLDWDEGPHLQTRRIDRYENVFREFRQCELVYPCTCSRADIESAASAPHAEHEGPAYPGTCAVRRSADAESLLQSFAWRFRVTDSPGFDDGFLGRVDVDIRKIGGDFVVWKSSGTPAYQLAVTVDDADMGVTDVIRGDDLVPSTPRQLLLYRAMNRTSPSFTHVPLVVGPDGRRLAKRHGDTRLATLRDAGVLPEALIGLLAWSCGWLEKPRPVSAQELIATFRFDTIPRSPFVLTPVLLRQIGF